MGKDRWQKLKAKLKEETGQSMAEYALIIGILVIAGVGILGGPLQGAVEAMYGTIRDKILPALAGH